MTTRVVNARTSLTLKSEEKEKLLAVYDVKMITFFLFCNNTKNLKIRNFWKKQTNKQTETLDSGKNIIHVASLPVYCIQKQGVHLLLLF